MPTQEDVIYVFTVLLGHVMTFQQRTILESERKRERGVWGGGVGCVCGGGVVGCGVCVCGCGFGVCLSVFHSLLKASVHIWLHVCNECMNGRCLNTVCEYCVCVCVCLSVFLSFSCVRMSVCMCIFDVHCVSV